MVTKHSKAVKAHSSQSGPAVRIIDSAELFGGCREVKIMHEQESYRLVLTRHGKLLLNK